MKRVSVKARNRNMPCERCRKPIGSVSGVAYRTGPGMIRGHQYFCENCGNIKQNTASLVRTADGMKVVPSGMTRGEFLKKMGAVGVVAGLAGAGLGAMTEKAAATPPPTQPWNVETMMDAFGYLVWIDSGGTLTYLAKSGKTGTDDYSETVPATLLQEVLQNAV